MVDRKSIEYDVRLKQIAAHAEMMNNLCDRLSDEMREVEEDINKTNIGIEVASKTPFQTEEVVDPNDFTKVVTQRRYLAYGKDLNWGILVRDVYSRDVNGEERIERIDTYPLLSASRTTRIAAYHYVEDLLDTIAQEAKQQANRL